MSMAVEPLQNIQDCGLGRQLLRAARGRQWLGAWFKRRGGA